MFKSSLSCCSCSAGPPHFTWLWPTRPADLIRLIEIWTWPDSSSGSGLGYRKPLTLAHRVHWHKLSAEGAKMSKCSFKAALWGHSEEQRGVQWHSLVKVLWLRQKRKAFSWVCRRLRSELSSISRKPPTNRFLLVCEAPDTSTPPPPRQLSESVGEHDKEHQEQTKVTTPQTNKEEEKELQVSPDAWQRTWRRRFPQLQKKKNRRHWTQLETRSLFVFWLQKDGHMIICSSLWTIGSPQNHCDVYYSVTSTQTRKYIQ